MLRPNALALNAFILNSCAPKSSYPPIFSDSVIFLSFWSDSETVSNDSTKLYRKFQLISIFPNLIPANGTLSETTHQPAFWCTTTLTCDWAILQVTYLGSFQVIILQFFHFQCINFFSVFFLTWEWKIGS